MKKYTAVFLIMVFVVLLAGCTEKIYNTKPELTTSITPAADVKTDSGETRAFGSADVPLVWERLHDTFARDDSSQYNNAVLMMKYLSNGCAMFEFRLMEGSEADDFAFDTIIAGVLIIDDNGTGVYETIPDAYNPFSIQFVLSDDGETVDVTYDGALEISPDGRYSFVEAYVEVSEFSAGAILEHLPTAATSLNSNLGAYTINYPDALISGWFYSVEAVFDDSGLTLAKFLVAKDMSAVFRADDDIEPVMIFGSAQPMMDAYVLEKMEFSATESGSSAEYEDVGEHEVPEDDYRQLVYVTLDSGAYMTPGTSGQLAVVLPYDLPYTWEIESLDETVAVADENGMVTAVGEGETAIVCVVMCEDGVALTGVYVYVTNELEYDDIMPG